MPHWIAARGSAVPPPPPPPNEPPHLLEPEYEVIEFSGQQTYSNQPIIRGKELKDKEQKRCDLCGSSAPAIKCMQCIQQNFCYSCDEMYHRHPKRQSHLRKELDGGGRPPLPPKGEPQPPPVPPPRRNKRATPRLQHSPQPPPVPPSPQISQRDPMSPKPGFMGSLKRMIGGRQLPIVPHGIDQQNQMPMNSSIMGFQDAITNCNGFQDWSELQRGARSGSFNTLNPPGFGQIMQTQSMAHLNCPSCQGHGMGWNPWNGMPAAGTWQSSAFLNRCPPKEEWTDSDSEPGWHRERQRRFSTMSARVPRSSGFNDTQSMRGGRRTDAETSSYKGSRRRDFDTMSSHGGSKRRDSDTMSSRGGSKRRDSDTMSMRGSRRSDMENSFSRSQKKFSNFHNHRYVDDNRIKDSESSDNDSDDDFTFNQGSRKIMSDVEEMRRGRKKSEPIISKHLKSEGLKPLKGQTKRCEKMVDTERVNSRVNSPAINNYDSPPDGNEKEIKYAVETESELDEKLRNGIEAAEVEEQEELGPVPDTEWECIHCTYVNQGGTRVCMVCCKTTSKPKLCKTSTSISPPTEEFKKKLVVEDKPSETPLKNSKELKEKRGNQTSEQNRILTSKGTSPPPQSISTQTYEEAGRKLKRATSLADYGDWKTPQRSASRQSLLSDTQSLPVTPPRSRSPEQKKLDINRRQSDQFSQRSLKRAGSQPPEYISSLVQKQVKQGLEMVKLLREAEEHQFSAEDLAVALLHCGEGDPINWLQENWRNMIDTVVTLGTNYGQERKENIVGTISASEARDALRAHDGNVWAAVTECVEQRQRKYAELLSRGNFSREDIVTVLTANHGNLEEAYKELNKNQLKPFLMRIWGPPQGADNDDGDITKLAHGELDGRGGKNSEEVSVDLSIESNYDRIQNWLDRVNVNNKSRFSQSMLQLNLTGNSRSELEWKFQTNTNNKTLVSSINRKTSDVHRYLTTLYNANEKSLKIDKNRYNSMQNLHTVIKPRSDSKTLHREENTSKQISNLTNNEDSENLKNEIETITIKLKPIVVDIEDENSESIQSENLNFIQKEETSYLIKHEQNVLHEKNNMKPNILPTNTNNKKSVFPSNDSNNTKVDLSRSDSETSSESFESLHSSSEENQNVYENMDLTNLETHSSTSNKIYENIDKLETISNEKNNFSDNELMIGSNQNSSNEVSQKFITNNHLDDKSNAILFQSKLNELPLRVTMHNEIPIDDSEVDQMSNKSENLETSYDDEEAKSFDSANESIEIKKDIVLVMEQTFVSNTPSKVNSYTSLYDGSESDSESDDDSNFTSSEKQTDNNPSEADIILENFSNGPKVLGDVNINNTRGMSSGIKTSDELIINGDNKGNYLTVTNENSHNKKKSSSSKSGSDINDNDSNDFSEESSDYIEEKISPIMKTPIKKDHIFHISDANSDNDVSSIKTDSAQEILSPDMNNDSSIKTEHNSHKINTLHSNQMELIDLLKKSLTKDDVVEKIVTTLFASVLQVPFEAHNLQELSFFPKSINNRSFVNEVEEIVDKSHLTNNKEMVDNTHLTNKKEIEEAVDNTHLTNNKQIEETIDNIHLGSNKEIEGSVDEPGLNSNKEIKETIDNTNLTSNKEIKETVDNTHLTRNKEIEETVDGPRLTSNKEIEDKVDQTHLTSNKEIVDKPQLTNKQEIEETVDNIHLTSNKEIEETVDEPCLTSKKEIEEMVDNTLLTSNKETADKQHLTNKNEMVDELHLTNKLEIVEMVDKTHLTTNKQIEETYANSHLMNNGTSSRNSSSWNNEQNYTLKKEIIIPTLILAKEEKTLKDNFEEEHNQILGNHMINESTMCVVEVEEPKATLFQREARRLLAEGLVSTYDQAEVALQLKELNLDDDDGIILTAANECDSLESAIAFLQQECQLCAGKCTAKQMISMLECEHRCCLECASNYFTMQITERNINDCICPFCKEPDILHMEEDKILMYFSHLDILLKGLLKENIHELFQRKLRDRTLMQDPNFKWCIKCSSGYIANPRQKRLMCPDCKAITCAKCMKPWEKEHERMSCEEYKSWLEHNDPENQLASHLDENGVTCPNCNSKYILAKGGCMHLICPHCKHEFCSGCSKPFLMGRKCSVSEYCEKLGLHSHHPRNCLFYLRDKEPEELEKLLEDNNIKYKNEEPVDNTRCNIQLLKETPEGMMEGICGYTTVKAGLCRKHYVERLSRLIRQNMLETICLLDEDDLETVVRRTGRYPPPNPYGTPKPVYRDRLLQDDLTCHRTHYVESLVTTIRNKRVDPVMLLDYGEALQELRRHGKEPPERPTGMLEYHHRQACLKVIADEIPLD